jgi:hypothetical protein
MSVKVKIIKKVEFKFNEPHAKIWFIDNNTNTCDVSVSSEILFNYISKAELTHYMFNHGLVGMAIAYSEFVTGYFIREFSLNFGELLAKYKEQNKNGNKSSSLPKQG